MSAISHAVYVLGGTCGTGKSTVSDVLVEALRNRFPNISFIEGDQLHPTTNVAKMSQGIPLNDDDRWGWLEIIAATSASAAEKYGGPCVITCSSLKRSYRDYIKAKQPNTKYKFFILYAPKAEVIRRMLSRKSHFMKADMVESQFADLELPTVSEIDSYIIDVNNKSIDEVVSSIISKIT